VKDPQSPAANAAQFNPAVERTGSSRCSDPGRSSPAFVDGSMNRIPTTHYFAYGSNMDVSQMCVRCPDSVLASVGSLAGWKFRINTRGVATIVPQDGSTVYGVLWRLSPADEESLDRYEGVGMGLYSKKTMDVRLSDGSRVHALVYVAEDDHPGTPRPEYLEGIVSAALRIGLPAPYVEELRVWSRTDA
jgi:cation transport regulator ChaC